MYIINKSIFQKAHNVAITAERSLGRWTSLSSLWVNISLGVLTIGIYIYSYIYTHPEINNSIHKEYCSFIKLNPVVYVGQETC